MKIFISDLSKIILVSFLLMYTIGLQAQTRDFDLRSTSFNGIDVGYSAAPFFTDLDQDGLLDLVIGDQYGFLRIYEQDEVNSTSFSGHTPFFMEGDDLNNLDVGSGSHFAYKTTSGYSLCVGYTENNVFAFYTFSIICT